MTPEIQLLVNAAITLAVAGVISFAVTPLVRRFAHTVGAIDVPNDARRVHTRPIPRLGGLAIFIGFIFSYLLFGQLTESVRGILIGCVIMVAVGVIDDIVALPWWAKFLGQIGAAAIPVLHGVKVERFSNPLSFFLDSAEPYINLGAWSIPVTILWIVIITNSVNYIDGLDGLAVGVSGIASLSMLILAVVLGDPVAAILMAAVAGGCVGFIPYNFNPARLFMGDTGALFLGFMLSTVSVVGLFKLYAIISFAVPFLILGLPIFDFCVSSIRRLARGKSPMSADRGHVHHKLIDMGFSQKQAVAILYTMSALLGLTAVVLTTTGEVRAILLLLVFVVAGAINFKIISDRLNGKGIQNAATAENDAEEPAVTEADTLPEPPEEVDTPTEEP